MELYRFPTKWPHAVGEVSIRALFEGRYCQDRYRVSYFGPQADEGGSGLGAEVVDPRVLQLVEARNIGGTLLGSRDFRRFFDARMLGTLRHTGTTWIMEDAAYFDLPDKSGMLTERYLGERELSIEISMDKVPGATSALVFDGRLSVDADDVSFVVLTEPPNSVPRRLRLEDVNLRKMLDCAPIPDELRRPSIYAFPLFVLGRLLDDQSVQPSYIELTHNGVAFSWTVNPSRVPVPLPQKLERGTGES